MAANLDSQLRVRWLVKVNAAIREVSKKRKKRENIQMLGCKILSITKIALKSISIKIKLNFNRLLVTSKNAFKRN